MLLEELHTVTLYRGMSQGEYAKLKQTGMYIPNIKNPHNDTSTDLETARYYASIRVHDDPGVVIKFKVPSSSVKQDSVTQDDYKILKPVDASKHEVIHSWSLRSLLKKQNPLLIGGRNVDWNPSCLCYTRPFGSFWRVRSLKTSWRATWRCVSVVVHVDVGSFIIVSVYGRNG